MATPMIRDPYEDESLTLALLADAATRRLMGWLWDQHTAVGQPSYEVGREIIRSDVDSLSHRSRWRVVQRDGRLAGGLNTYVLPPIEAPAVEVAAVMEPLRVLKTHAVGTQYVAVASVVAECRGQGVGQVLLHEAERIARANGAAQMTLVVADFNEGAFRLYRRFGFREWHRGEFVPFPGSDPHGEWILMVKDLDETPR